MGPPSDVTTRPPIFAVLTGGGTAGHVIPALALAELLIEDGIEREALHYLGTQRGVEAQLLPSIGVAATYVRVAGLVRGWSLTALWRNLFVLIGVVRARQAAIRLFREISPRVVVSVGGYGSVPGCAAAKRLGIPVVTCSYDRRPGLATRRQSRYAAAVAVAHLPSDLPHATLTGAPVRAALRHLDCNATRDGARQRLGLPAEGMCVVVVGGSLGSRVLNEAVSTMLNLLDHAVSIVHIAGDRYVSELGGEVAISRSGGNARYLRMGSTQAMSDVYAAADVIVARAGASTVAEVATVGCAAVFVPWKDAAEDHQTANARWLADEGGAVVVQEDDEVVAQIVTEVSRLVGDDEARNDLAHRAYACGAVHRHASHAAVIRSVAR